MMDSDTTDAAWAQQQLEEQYLEECMDHSTEISELVAALSIAQGKITGALKDSVNPFYKSKYSDLASCWDACREQLTHNGLAVVQGATADEHGVGITTMLTHKSGQWMRSTLRVMPKDASPQGIGSCITYLRRYSLCAMIGIAQVDDDANAASAKEVPRSTEITGDLGAVSVDEARELAFDMVAALNADVSEEAKALSVFDLHDRIKTMHDLYMAASAQLKSNERAAWKKYVEKAKQLAKEDSSRRAMAF
jgi:hypothetical protein